MGKINLTCENPPNDLEGLRKFVADLSKDVHQQINGQLLFGDNIRGQFLDLTFEEAQVEKIFRHTLGRIPQGFIITYATSYMVLWISPTTKPTPSEITFVSYFTGTIRVFIF